jgi:hypothetical protein
LRAQFTSHQELEGDQSEDEYVNECCVMSYEGPNRELQQLSREK